MSFHVLAQAAQRATDIQELKSGWGSLIFTGCFFIGLIIVAIWWLRRSA